MENEADKTNLIELLAEIEIYQNMINKNSNSKQGSETHRIEE